MRINGSAGLNKYNLTNHLGNDRVYDPILGMFNSPDPFVQSPMSTQNYNRYTYVLNNPLKYIDPSGYKKCYKKEPKWWRDMKDRWSNFLIDLGNLGNSDGDNINPSPNTRTRTSSQPDVSLFGVNAETIGFGVQSQDGVGAQSGGGNTLFLLGLGLTANGAQGTANMFQISNHGVKTAALNNNFPTTAIDDIMSNTSKFANGAKWIGRGVVVLGAGISVYQGYDAYTRGDNLGVQKAKADFSVGITAAWIGGIPGFLLYGGYMLMTQPLHYVPYYPNMNVFPNDNTNVAIPIVPIK